MLKFIDLTDATTPARKQCGFLRLSTCTFVPAALGHLFSDLDEVALFIGRDAAKLVPDGFFE